MYIHPLQKKINSMEKYIPIIYWENPARYDMKEILGLYLSKLKIRRLQKGHHQMFLEGTN